MEKENQKTTQTKGKKCSSEQNILVAFLLNFIFTAIEIIGGIFTNSIAIFSDAVHDFGDSVTIGLSYFLEKKASKKPNKKYTFGYARIRILSALITSAVLLIGSGLVIYESINRLIHPQTINGMWIFIISIIGIIFNSLAVFKTSKSENINEKAINLHILEDVLGWVVVFVGSIFMWAFNVVWLDSVLSLIVTAYVLWHVVRNFIEIFRIFLQKAPKGFDEEEFKKHLCEIDKIKDIHHFHIWSLDSQIMLASCHVVLEKSTPKNCLEKVKTLVKKEAREHGIAEIVVEFEFEGQECESKECECSENCKHNIDGHCHLH